MSEKNTGRVTIPTNLDVVPETIELMKRWGADAIRDCDGTEFPEELTKTGAKIYATYYTTRKDNEWAKANPDEVQQCYIMSGFYTAVESELQIPLMKGISDELMQVPQPVHQGCRRRGCQEQEVTPHKKARCLPCTVFQCGKQRAFAFYFWFGSNCCHRASNSSSTRAICPVR